MSRLFLLTFLCLLAITIGCECPPSTFQENFHKADSVVRVEVHKAHTRGRTPRPPCEKKPCPKRSEYQTSVFKMQIIVVYKGCGPSTPFFRGISMTGPGYCGTYLEPGEKYVVNLGKEVMIGGKKTGYLLDSCQGHRLFANLTESEQIFLGEEAGKPENHCPP